MDQVSLRDLKKTNNLMTWAQLREHAPGFDWAAWLGGLGAEETAVGEVVVAHRAAGVRMRA